MKMKPEESTDSAEFRANLLTQEINFAKMLAGNEFNAAIKEKHIKKLSNWLKNRSACSEAFTDRDCMRVWKGLFYSMWMSDKPLPQENLANKIAALVHSFSNIESSMQFFAMFLKTMAIEWGGIDQWRIDKFMMLVRKVTREVLRILQKNDWNDEAIEVMETRMRQTVLGSDNVPRGLFMHFTELFFEEVAKVANGEIEPRTVTKLLHPFMFYVASQKDYKLIQFVVRHVFNYLLFQTEEGREYKEKFDAWKMMGFPGKSIDEMVMEETDANGMNGESNSEEEGESSNSDDSDNEAEEQTQDDVLDPRAGRVDVVMNEIRFDPVEIVSELEDLKYKKFTRVRNRKCIDRIVTTYKKFASGKFPIGIQKLKVDRDELELPDIDSKAEEMVEFERELFGETRELKKLNKRKRKRILSNPDLFDEFKAKSNKIAKMKHDANKWTEEDITPDEEQSPVATAEKPKKIGKTEKLKTKAKLLKNNAAVKTTEGEQKKLGKKHKSNGWDEPLQDGEVEYIIPSKKQQLNGAQRIVMTKDDSLQQKTPEKIGKVSAVEGSAKKSSFAVDDTPKRSPKTASSVEKKTKKLSESKPTPKSMPIIDGQKAENSTPVSVKKLSYGTPKKSTPTQHEKKVKSASKFNQSNNSTPATPIFAAKTPKIANSTPNATLLSSAEKRVKIVLKMNKSQEATEYIKQLKNSPHLPYDSAKKPLKGVLKPNLMPSPINPFYKKMIGFKN